MKIRRNKGIIIGGIIGTIITLSTLCHGDLIATLISGVLVIPTSIMCGSFCDLGRRGEI